MAYEFKRDTTPTAHTIDGRPVIRVPEGMTKEEALLWANGITDIAQVNGLKSYYEQLKEQEVNYQYALTTADKMNTGGESVFVPGRKRKGRK